MASPTEAEIQTQFSNAVNCLEFLINFTSEQGTSFLDLENTFTTSLETDFAVEASETLAALRSRLDSSLREAASVFTPHLRTYARFLDIPEVDVAGMFSRLYDNFVDNSLTVNSREYTFGDPTIDGGATGDGDINRLNVDREGFDIESQFADAKVAKCINDQNTGAPEHEEVFEFIGASSGRDALQLDGSGKKVLIKSYSATDSLLINSSFSRFSGVLTGPTTIFNWDVSGAIANLQMDQTDFFRAFPGDTTPTSLRFDTNELIRQQFIASNIVLNPDVPYILQLAYNRAVGSGDGTLTLTMGSRSANVVFAAQAGWNLLQLAIDTNSWPDNFTQQDTEVSIDLASNTTGYVLVDDVLLVPMVPFDNSWYAVIGGENSFLKEDEFGWSDTETGLGILQKWFWRSFGTYLPSDKTGGETWVDPS